MRRSRNASTRNVNDTLARNPGRKKRRQRSASNLSFEKLEARNLLAAVSFDGGPGLLEFTADVGEVDVVEVSTPAADSLQILVGNGDEISLQGDAAANANFVLSTTSTVNDTLTIDLGVVTINDFVSMLGDLDDVYTFTGITGVGSVLVSGEAGADIVDGSAVSQSLTLIGGAGNDTLTGGSGDDVLAGGGGSDVIDGGAGIDTNSFQGIGIGVTATINADGSGAAAYGAVNETFAGIENLTGSANDDNLTGNDLANVIDGGLGDDIIVGAGGDDILFGGSGADTIFGGDGDDSVVGGFGDDLLNGDGGNDSVVGNGQIEVTVTNLNPTDGSLLTPVFVATQNGIYDQLDVGSAASENIERLAEDGTVGPRIAAALGSGGVNEALATPSPLMPGDSFTLTFFADPTNPLTQFLSYASMVIPSNDAFIGNDDPMQIDLFDDNGSLIRRVGSNVFIVTGDDVWDAGTEVNDEIPENTAALAQTAPDTGVTENGVIIQHPGFQGSQRLGGPIGNVLTATPAGDFTVPGFQVMSIEVDDAARELGFSVEVENQFLDSLTTAQTPAQLVAEAASDNLYFNVHTQNFPGGEIRGQLLLQSDQTVDGVRTLSLTASLDSAQEPGPTSDSDATGMGTLTIVVDGTRVTYSSTLSITGIETSDLMPVAGVSSIHLHNAPAGANGPVIVDIIQDAGGDINGVAQSPAADTGDGNVFVEVLESDNDTINGGSGEDRLVGGIGDDVLTGGDGDDELIGSAGDDILRGANGDDVAFGGSGNDSLNGGPGNDTLSGNEGDDFFVGIGGTDSIDGGAGNDTNSFQGIGLGVSATVNADGTGTASYGTVNETFVGIENLTGSANDDILRAVGLADNVLQGLEGNDLLEAGAGDDLLVGNSGNDILRGGNGDDLILGIDGDDALNGGGGNDSLVGGDGNDFFVGIGGTDLIIGGAGFDTNSFQGIGLGVTARINDDGSGSAQYGAVNESFSGIERLVGSDNDDILIVTGSRGTQLLGLGGNDLLVGGFGNDVLVGGDGNDLINGRAGADSLLAGAGNDTLNGGAGNDFANGDEGDDIITGGAGNDQLVGGDGRDTIFGNEGLDFIFGGLGDDSIFGGDDDDELLGGDGNDLLVGGLGIDLLFGGLGVDEEIQ